MRKAIFFKSKYYREVAENANITFAYWADSLMQCDEYVNYGNPFHHYYMKKMVMMKLQFMTDYGGLSFQQLMDALKQGADYGVADWETIFLDEDLGPKEEAEQNETLYNHSQGFPDYTAESLIDPANFATRDGLLYSTISYHEAQHLYTWINILEQYKVFEPIFIKHHKQYLKDNNLEPYLRFKE